MTRQSSRGVSATISDWGGRIRRGMRLVSRQRYVRASSLSSNASAIRYCWRRPEPGNDPLEVAAEAEEPDAVALAEIGLGQRCGRAHGVVERTRRARPGGPERVEEDDDVGASLGQPIADEEPAARGGRTPVDSPGTLAGCEEPELRELDAFAGDRGRTAAGHRACRPRHGEPSQPLHRRVDPQRRGRLEHELGANGGEADRVPRAGLERRCGRRPSEGSRSRTRASASRLYGA